MWLEIGMGVLLVLALVQCAVLYRLWQHSLQLQQRVEQVVHDTARTHRRAGTARRPTVPRYDDGGHCPPYDPPRFCRSAPCPQGTSFGRARCLSSRKEEHRA
jgi:hypothetical protein